MRSIRPVRHYGGAPGPAAAAGYNTLTFSDDFTSSSTIAPTKTTSSGYNWYWGLQAATSGNPTTCWSMNTTAMASSISNGNSGGGSYASINGGILTITGPAFPNDALMTIPGWALNTGGAVRPAAGNWQYGYFEGYLQFNTTHITGVQANGWPAFWMWGAEGLNSEGFVSSALNATTTEFDLIEAFGTIFGGGAGSWGSAVHQPAGSTTVYSTSLTNADNNWHQYGILWTPGNIAFYLDNALQGSHSTSGWSIATQHMFMIMGTGNQSGGQMNVDWVRVWQAP